MTNLPAFVASKLRKSKIQLVGNLFLQESAFFREFCAFFWLGGAPCWP